jgi:ribosomal-protein-alanine N-acetyltransferase
MNTEIEIREYTTADKEAVVDLLRLNTPVWFAPQEEADLVYYLENEIDHYFVLVLNHQIVGCGGINFSEDKNTGILSWDIMHPAHKGKALGSTLVKYRIDHLKKYNTIEQIIVRTTQLVYPFYEKQGFKLIKTQENYWAQGFDLYHMVYTT